MELLIIDKEGKDDLELAFKLLHKEIKCKCNYPECTYTIISERVLRIFGILRKYWGSAIFVTSAFRCMMHNIDSKGAPDSWHKRGMAIDLVPKNGDLLGLYDLASKFFDLVILYEEEGFIHCQSEEKYE